MTIWFTSDLHFSHKKVIEYSHRPFSSIKEMDEKLIENWNKKVSNKDIGYILGDFSFAKPKDTIEFIQKMNGQKHLLLGNHDSRMKDWVKKQFVSCQHYLELKIPDTDCESGNQRIILSHFPFLTWNRASHNSWMLHGHCHGTLVNNRGKRLDVGIDCHDYFPISYEQIKEIMKTKEFALEDRHGSDKRE